TVIENLLDNARSKRMREPELKIVVQLSNINKQLCLSVCDMGSAITEQIAQQLFNEVVSSQDGFGIGLYQCNELAKNHDYKLSIEDNTTGHVCFSLTST
ncbi:MAG: ATP-binding protein, partial [Gammaproteobacteria bacterium]|nr:ATP-binding protein [Gammaproteobacteria bacterium]